MALSEGDNMQQQVDLYNRAYADFDEDVLNTVRLETYGRDIGQSSWTTADEYVLFASWLKLTGDSRVLEVASGSGGPAAYLAEITGCCVTGIDCNESGVANGNKHAPSDRVRFLVADANARLPFEDNTFDAIISIDAMNHLPDRVSVLKEWKRVLVPGGRALYTDPVVVAGPITNSELFTRSSIGTFVFMGLGKNEEIIGESGLQMLDSKDVTENAGVTSQKWFDARAKHREALLKGESQDQFQGLQDFLWCVHTLTNERRVLRVAYLLEKPSSH